MVALKRTRGRYIVTVREAELDFDTLHDALVAITFISLLL